MNAAEAQSALPSVVLVGATALKGREVRDVLSERGFPADCKLLDDDEALGQLDEVNGEAAFIQAAVPEHLEGADFAFLTGAESYIAKVSGAVRSAGAQCIDLSYALENEPGAVLRAPWVESEQGGAAPLPAPGAPIVIAQPAAVVLSLLLGRLRKAAAIEFASAVVCQPASEHGRRGIDELHDQTINLLSFQAMPSEFFGTQSAFNLYNQPVEAAHTPLPLTEARVLRHFRAIAREQLAPPALLLLQAPVFHGYVFAVFVRTASPVSAAQLEAALTGPHVSLVGGGGEFPSNVSIAGSAEILVNLRADVGAGNGCWLFAACDNLRISAVQAVECAEQLLRARLREKTP
jgi:aspartate-semialdehyde dehydrogenase